MTLTVVHISDLHFGAPNADPTAEDALRLVAEALHRDFGAREDWVLCLSGDLTTYGDPSGYQLAEETLITWIRGLKFAKVVICPGNHDIVDNSPAFEAFNRFAFRITNDSTQMYSAKEPVRVVPVGDWDFVMVNSSFHADHSFGRVPIDQLRNALGEAAEKTIVVIHHSPISSDYGGSSLAQSYELLRDVADKRSAALLHGHVHSDQVLFVGRRPTAVLGAGSLSFPPDRNMNNQFSIHEFEGDYSRSITYRYFANTKSFRGEEIQG